MFRPAHRALALFTLAVLLGHLLPPSSASATTGSRFLSAPTPRSQTNAPARSGIPPRSFVPAAVRQIDLAALWWRAMLQAPGATPEKLLARGRPATASTTQPCDNYYYAGRTMRDAIITIATFRLLAMTATLILPGVRIGGASQPRRFGGASIWGGPIRSRKSA
jgi:hypothetical protein